MSLARVTAFALDGVDSRRVWVEADIRIGLPAFTIVGLADKAVREARERVRSAITNSGFEFPQKRITINLAPAYLRKIGPSFDLPLAMSILAASGQVEREQVEDCVFAGELSLTGELRPIRGALAVAQGTRAHGLARIVVPASRACEAALVDGVEVVAADSLVAVADILAGRAEVPPLPEAVRDPDDVVVLEPPDMCDVRGHDALLPAIVVAAAGGHNLFLHGPPGTGKTMIARRVPSILPPLARSEAIEVTRIHSIAGLHSGGGLVEARPFRAPHHTISPSGLVGGGVRAATGRDHARAPRRAVPRRALGVRALVARGAAAAARGRARGDRPLAAGDAVPDALHARRGVESLSVRARRPPLPLLRGRPRAPPAPPQRPAARPHRRHRRGRPPERGRAARAARAVVRVAARAGGGGAGAAVAALRGARRGLQRPDDTADGPRARGATPSALRLLYELHDRDGLSARGHHRVLRVARTAADLEGSDVVGPEHVTAALAHRTDAAPNRSAA